MTLVLCSYYIYSFAKGDVHTKRSLLQEWYLDFSKQEYMALRRNEIRESVIPFLIDAINSSASKSRPYLEWGRRWQIDHWHLVDGMRIYLEKLDGGSHSFKNRLKTKESDMEEMSYRTISIKYKNNIPSIEHTCPNDQKYYQHDIYRALAKEIVDRHLITRHLEDVFEVPMRESYSQTHLIPQWERRMHGLDLSMDSPSRRRVLEDELKEKRDLYKSFWENPLDFAYEGNWLEDKNFPCLFANTLWKKYCEPFPLSYFEEW